MMGWLANVKVGGTRLTAGAGKPLPLSRTVCGVFAALSLMVNAPYGLPTAVGLKVTSIIQLVPGGIVVRQ